MNLKIIAFAITSLMVITSCKKHYTCECTTVGEIVGTSVNDSTSETTPKSSKDDAQAWCEQNNKNISDGDITLITKCKLK